MTSLKKVKLEKQAKFRAQYDEQVRVRNDLQEKELKAD